jgi:hypothetical protein
MAELWSIVERNSAIGRGVVGRGVVGRGVAGPWVVGRWWLGAGSVNQLLPPPAPARDSRHSRSRIA